MTCIESNPTERDKLGQLSATNVARMKRSYSHSTSEKAESRDLDTADAVARAAHLWIRSICLNENQKADERHALAGGLIAGLCECLAVNGRVRELVAYVYLLLDDEGAQALELSRLFLEAQVPERLREAHERGRSEATGIVEMLLFHDRKRSRRAPN
jgi:hypothetical protein